jgi:hypothetical protein
LFACSGPNISNASDGSGSNGNNSKTKSASGRLGRDAAAIAEEISSSSNPQSAKAKNTSTIPSAEDAGINSQTDVQASATETGTTP